MRRPPSSEIPDAPGAYLFRDAHGAVLYVGKAKSLRKRLANYFARDLQPRTRAMVDAAGSVEWIVTDGEIAALHLEFNLIKQHAPRFNIRLKDDKSFPYLAITRSEDWPRALVMRGRRRKGTEYFGPYAHAYAIRQTLDLLLRTFPVRTCTNAKFRRHEASGRPCLLFHIERCSGPCVGEVDDATYADHVDGLAAFLDGDRDDVTAALRDKMSTASASLEFETAARFRDQLQAVERALARQEMVGKRRDTFSLIAATGDELEAALVVLEVHQGRVVGRRTMIVDRVEDVTTSELIGRFIHQLYGDDRPPPELLVTQLPDEAELWQAWLEERRGAALSLRVPQRGAKRRLMETAMANAEEEFARHRLKRASDHNARARAINSLQGHLDLPQAPLRIECYDISTIQGRDTVGSMVVLEDGLPRKSDYKRFKVRTVTGQDDFAAMEEVLRRRFRQLVEQRELPVEERGKFAYPPSLVLIDGGAGQLGRAVQVLEEFELDIPVAGLAKRMEEVYLPGRPDPVQIPRGEEALYLLQRVRDEAHRFAVSYHRSLRGKRMVDSILDDVPGIGPGRKKKLMRRFGSLKRIREADVHQLAEEIPESVARDLYNVLHEEVLA
ncbi:MAG: excinuclease ABC subunit UvrC [Acidimicrobiia bacterium]|nr:excinuclease ABC subunit UvrC [Acidimicrobiia bacterium]